jgi:hypothetical protein
MSKITKSEIMGLGGPTAFLETLSWPQGVDDCTKENGFTIHCENEPTVLDPRARTYWSLEMAMVWIAFRDHQQVGRVWSEYRKDCCLELQGFYDDGGQVRGELQTPNVSSVWADMLFSRDNNVSLEAASELLRLKLESGTISATGVQSSERKAIDAHQWCDLYFLFRLHRKGDCIVYTDAKKWDLDTLPEYTRVCVPVKEMLKAFPVPKASASLPVQKLSRPEARAMLKRWQEEHGKVIPLGTAYNILKAFGYTRSVSNGLATELNPETERKRGRPTSKNKSPDNRRIIAG